MPKVSLITYTQDPEKIVAAAAKLCYSSSTADNIFNALTDKKIASFVDMLSSVGHESPIEHISFTFSIQNVSRALLAQLTRHRIASYSVKSQRYVNENCFKYVIPPEIEKLEDAKTEYINSMEEINKHYLSLTSILKAKHKKFFIEQGYDFKTASRLAEKKAIEDARFVLPNACETQIICTMNARSLINFFSHRCCNRAQWEIRSLANEMLKLVIKVAPNIFKSAGPACLKGKCPEGNMTCGKIKEVKHYFEELKKYEC